MRGKGGVGSGSTRVAAWRLCGSMEGLFVAYRVERTGYTHLMTFAFSPEGLVQLSSTVLGPYFFLHTLTAYP